MASASNPFMSQAPRPCSFAVLFGQRERIAVPVLAVDRNHVGMTRQDDAALDLGTHMGIEARLLTGRVIVPVTGDAVVLQIALHPVDEGEVRVAAHRREAHEFFKEGPWD